MRRARFAAALLFVPLAGCASGGGPGAGGLPAQPRDVHWVRSSAEHAAIFAEVYRWAGEYVAGVRRGGQAPGTWAVILDVDETVLDNSEYQRRRAALGEGYSSESWNEWVREGVATALPGALRFIQGVRENGGRVVLVTNRDEVVCDPTRANLERLQIAVDLVLCRGEGVRGKQERFDAVAGGTAADHLPPLDVVAWIGDNIEDFPGGNQEMDSRDPVVMASFGARFFVLPNPMYGSWERNTPR